MITVLQVGFGPLGIQIGKYITQKETINTVAVVDVNPNLKENHYNQSMLNCQKTL